MKQLSFYSLYLFFLCHINCIFGITLPKFPCDSLGIINSHKYVEQADTTYLDCLLRAIEFKNGTYTKDPFVYSFDLANIYTNMGQYKSALHVTTNLFDKALILSDTINIYSLINYLYIKTQRLSKAKETILNGLDLAKLRNDKGAIARMYYELSIIDQKLEDKNKAFENIDAAVKLISHVKNESEKARILYEKACIIDLYGNFKQKKEIPTILESSIDYFLKNEEKYNVISCKSLLAYHYGQNDEFSNFPQAEKLLLENLRIAKTEFKDIKTECETLIGLSFIYMNNKQYDLVSKYAKQAYSIAKSIDNYYDYSYACHIISEAADSLNNHKEALNYYIDHMIAEDTITVREQRQKIIDLETKYKTKEQADALRIANQNNLNSQQQRNLFILLTITFLVLCTFLVIFLVQKNKLNKVITKQYQDVKELNLFKNQLFAIIGHDLRGILSRLNFSVSKLNTAIKNNNKERFADLSLRSSTDVEKLNGLVENLLYWGMQQSESISIYKESIHIEKAISQVIYNFKSDMEHKSITININAPENIILITDSDILKLCLRNLISNAIKFSDKGSEITIRVKETLDSKSILVKDYGLGISEANLDSIFEIGNSSKIKEGTNNERGTGLGLWICREMLFKVGATINVYSQLHKGSEFKLTFPKEKYA